MEWERAKSFLLLFFVLLNLVLGGLLFMENRRYIVTPEREQTILAIMERNNITFDAQFMRQFPPMRAISVTGFYYNVNELAEIFLENPENAERLDTPHGLILTDGPSELVIAHGFISYYNPSGHGSTANDLDALNPNAAQALTDAFVRAHWPDFRLDDVFIADDWLRFSYRQVYRGYIIHTNFIELIVTDMGIEQVDMQFGRVIEWYGQESPIAAPDEVLLTFVQRVRSIAQVSPITITHMDLVYFQEDEGSANPYASYRVLPYYRVFIDGSSDPFLINAFTNEIID